MLKGSEPGNKVGGGPGRGGALRWCRASPLGLLLKCDQVLQQLLWVLCPRWGELCSGGGGGLCPLGGRLKARWNLYWPRGGSRPRYNLGGRGWPNKLADLRGSDSALKISWGKLSLLLKPWVSQILRIHRHACAAALWRQRWGRQLRGSGRWPRWGQELRRLRRHGAARKRLKGSPLRTEDQRAGEQWRRERHSAQTS